MNYLDLAKEGTFLHDYMRWNDPLETPRAYDFWCAMWLISNAVGRRMVVKRPHAPVFLNMYCILCADAGVTRKSTAVSRCETVFRAASLDADAYTVAGSITPEALVENAALKSLNGDAHIAIISSELVQLLGKQHYAAGLPGLLTDIYDCPTERKITRSGGNTILLRQLYPTLLGASTAAWLIRAINPDVIEGGFTSRCIFIVDERRKRHVAWPGDGGSDDHSSQLSAGCVQKLQAIREEAKRWQQRGITLTNDAREHFTKWYETRDDSDPDPYVASFSAREDHHVLRLAGLLCANDGNWVIKEHHIKNAIKVIEHCKKGASALFGTQKANMKLVAGFDKLRDVLASAGSIGLTQSELLFKCRSYLSAREIEYAMALMHELEMVQRFDLQTKGRNKTLWRGTNKLLVRSLQQLVQRRLTE